MRHLEKKVKELARLAVRSSPSGDVVQSKDISPLKLKSLPLSTISSNLEQYQGFDCMSTLSQVLIYGVTETDKTAALTQYNHVSRYFEDVAIQNALQLSFGYISQSIAKKCLDIYWAWVNPVNLTIYRPSFFRDMASYSSTNSFNPNCCYSPALLSTIFSATISLLYDQPGELGKIIDQHSHTLLIQEMLAPASLATVASFINSAIQAMQGNEGNSVWMFSGIANRLAEDTNLFSIPNNLELELTVQDAESRSRLAWAVFYWDKLFSLYFSRLPCISNEPFPINGSILDDSMDNQPWDPIITIKGDRFLENEINKLYMKIDTEEQEASFSKGKTASSQDIQVLETASLKLKFYLLMIINSIITRIYGQKDSSLVSCQFSFGNPNQMVVKTKDYYLQTKVILSELTTLWNNTSDNLKVQANQQGCLNPVTVFNNLIYNTSVIILLVPLAQIEGILESEELELGVFLVESTIKIVSLYIRYFGKFYPNYWLEYAPYMSAQFLLILLQRNLLPKRHSQILQYSEALLKILQKPLFQLPRLIQTKLELDKYLNEDGNSVNTHQLFKSPGLEFSVDPSLQIPKAYTTPHSTTTSQIGPVSVAQLSEQDAFVQYKTGFLLQQHPSIRTQEDIQNTNMGIGGVAIMPTTYAPTMPDMITRPYYIPPEVHDQFTQHMDLSHSNNQHHPPINQNPQYTFMPQGSQEVTPSTGVPSFLGQFSSSTSTATTTSSIDEQQHQQHQQQQQSQQAQQQQHPISADIYPDQRQLVEEDLQQQIIWQTSRETQKDDQQQQAISRHQTQTPTPSSTQNHTPT